jgi:hypothetical protein
MRKLLMLPVLLLPLGLGACYHEGPAERAGKSLDNAGNKVEDAVNPPQGPAQAAGRKVDRALGND